MKFTEDERRNDTIMNVLHEIFGSILHYYLMGSAEQYSYVFWKHYECFM